MVLDGQPYTIAGVLPESFRFPPQVYVPLVPNLDRRWYYLHCVGRLKPGVSREQAQADLDAVSRAVT